MKADTPRFSRLAEDLVGSLRRIPSDDPKGARRRPSLKMEELVEALCSKHGIGRVTAEQSIRDHWPQIVGPANASYSHAVRIDERGRLVVHASHSVVRNELFMNRAEIVERIQKLPGCGSIRLLHLAQG